MVVVVASRCTMGGPIAGSSCWPCAPAFTAASSFLPLSSLRRPPPSPSTPLLPSCTGPQRRVSNPPMYLITMVITKGRGHPQRRIPDPLGDALGYPAAQPHAVLQAEAVLPGEEKRPAVSTSPR